MDWEDVSELAAVSLLTTLFVAVFIYAPLAWKLAAVAALAGYLYSSWKAGMWDDFVD